MPTKQSKYVLGGIGFATKESIRIHCREITIKYGHGNVITDPTDAAFVMDVLLMSESAEEIIGVGVKHFMPNKPEQFTGMSFMLLRVDGSSVAFGYNVCINGKRNPKTHFNLAARRAVLDQILEFKRAAFAAGPVYCALSGVQLSESNCHVDHAYPATFSAILEEYTAVYAWQDHKLASDKGGVGTIFADESDTKRFAEFHRERARLRVLLPKENMSLGNRSASSG